MPVHQKWVFTTPGDIRAAPAIGLDGNVYIGIEKDGVNADNPDDADAMFCALNGATGHKRWIYLARGEYPTVTPVAANGLAYFMTGDGNIIALDAKTGRKKWSFSTHGTADESEGTGICVSRDNAIYATTLNLGLFAIDGRTGHKKWNRPDLTRFPSDGPAIGPDGTIFFTALRGKTFGSSYTNMLVQAINPVTGKTIWAYDTGIRDGGDEGLSQPTVYNGKVYVYADKCIALNAASGRLVWQHSVGQLAAKPAIGPSGSVLVLESTTNTRGPIITTISAFNGGTGATLWQSRIVSPSSKDAYPEHDVVGPTYIPSGAILFVSGSSLVAVNSSRGMKVWSTQIANLIGGCVSNYSGLILVRSVTSRNGSKNSSVFAMR